MDRKEARRMDRFSQFAVASTSMAIKDCRLNLDEEDPLQIGTVLGVVYALSNSFGFGGNNRTLLIKKNDQ